MEEFIIFRKIVAWMIYKKGITTNDILKMANITIDHYQLIIEDKVDSKQISVTLKVAIQDFNKKHFSDFLESNAIDKLDDDPNFVSQKDSDAKDEPNHEKIKQVKEKMEEAKVESKSVNDLLYSPERNKRRIAERVQEKVFNEALQRLRDVTPNHMTFDIILKHR